MKYARRYGNTDRPYRSHQSYTRKYGYRKHMAGIIGTNGTKANNGVLHSVRGAPELDSQKLLLTGNGLEISRSTPSDFIANPRDFAIAVQLVAIPATTLESCPVV